MLFIKRLVLRQVYLFIKMLMPLSLSNISWLNQLNLNKKHLKALAENQLRQLQHVLRDEKVASYYDYQIALKSRKRC